MRNYGHGHGGVHRAICSEKVPEIAKMANFTYFGASLVNSSSCKMPIWLKIGEPVNKGFIVMCTEGFYFVAKNKGNMAV